jgi:hypothetical protein
VYRRQARMMHSSEGKITVFGFSDREAVRRRKGTSRRVHGEALLQKRRK